MKVRFIQTATMFRYDGSIVNADGVRRRCVIPREGEYDLPDDKARELIRNYPDNFSAVVGGKSDTPKPGTGEDKSATPKPGTGEDKKGGRES